MKTAEYYDRSDYLGDELLAGTGVIGLISGDQLHPPMIDDSAIWRDASLWKQGAAEHVRRLLVRAQINAADVVLDVGCGVGGAARMLTREFGARAFGVNISGTQLRTARKLGEDERYVLASAEVLPFEAGSFYCVATVNMFYHVADKQQALREMYRVTQPGGVLAFDDWVLTDRAEAHDRKELHQHWNPEPVEWLTDSALLEAIQEAGFELEQVDDFSAVGRGVMAEHFADTFERQVRPMIVAHDAAHGNDVAHYLRAAIDHTIELYKQEKMRYLQLIARKF